jgi:hypothetical protein
MPPSTELFSHRHYWIQKVTLPLNKWSCLDIMWVLYESWYCKKRCLRSPDSYQEGGHFLRIRWETFALIKNQLPPFPLRVLCALCFKEKISPYLAWYSKWILFNAKLTENAQSAQRELYFKSIFSKTLRVLCATSVSSLLKKYNPTELNIASKYFLTQSSQRMRKVRKESCTLNQYSPCPFRVLCAAPVSSALKKNILPPYSTF